MKWELKNQLQIVRDEMISIRLFLMETPSTTLWGVSQDLGSRGAPIMHIKYSMNGLQRNWKKVHSRNAGWNAIW